MKTGIFLIIDEDNSRCGITDRLKTAVGLCYAARCSGIGFHFIHRAGFDLRRYLLPNRIDWSAELSDLSADPSVRQEIRYVAPYDDLPEFREGIQYVCREYIGNNLIEKRGVPDWQRVWRDLFHELFIPAAPVREALSEDGLPERYAAVVIRFINSLGQAEDTGYNAPLPPDAQKGLIAAALEKAAACREESDVPVIVYSDSPRFLNAAAAAGFRTTDADGVGNIMNGDVGEYVTLRTFVNLFQMAGAEKVYSILHLEGFPQNSLYNTQYPRYAAIIGNRPFVRL